MIKKLLIIFYAAICCTACAQVVVDPIREGAEAGRTYYKWVLDINHDGVNDVLISLKETPDEIKEAKAEERNYYNPNYRGFAVYIGLKNGGYVKNKTVTESIGDVTGGIGVDISSCYVGFIDEVKQYGIVTVEEREVTAPSGKGMPVSRMQVYCYTILGDHLKRTNLTPLIDPDGKNPIYDTYLSAAKRTKVQLQEVTP